MAIKRVLIMAGGTGGHVFPALAIAHAMHARGVKVQWLGARGGLEERLVPAHFPISYIVIKGLRGKGMAAKLWSPVRLLLAVIQSYRIVRRLRPDLVLGMGGYVAGPGGVAAYLARIPLIIHEQNSVAGLTNRLLAKIARTVLQAFPHTFPERLNAVVTGNPVRAELLALPPPQERFADRRGPLRVLVLGGSQGARPINRCLLRALANYPTPKAITVWHQTGELDCEYMQNQYATIPMAVKIDAFIMEMAQAYGWADVVICRAGALTVSEIATVGLGAVFVPYPFAVDDHQLHNARYLEQAGAALIIVQPELTEKRVIDLLQQFVNDRAALAQMAECAHRVAQSQAVERVLAECH